MTDKPKNLVDLAHHFIQEGLPLDPVKHLVLAVKAEQQKEYALADEWSGKRWDGTTEQQRQGMEAEAQYHRAAANALCSVLGDQTVLSQFGLLHEDDEITVPLPKPQLPQRWVNMRNPRRTALITKIDGRQITLQIDGTSVKGTMDRAELLNEWRVLEGPGAR